MGKEASQTVSAQAVQAYLRRRGYADAQVIALAPLGQRTQEGLKSYGYGRPLRATFTAGGNRHDLVIRTMSPDPFGHERRSDRAAVLMLAYDTFSDIPRHIRALDQGVFDGSGHLIPMPAGEMYLLTDYVEGELYAADLHTMQQRQQANALDLQRARALGVYLATLHATPVSAGHYVRSVRDTIGSGEGIFGIIDGYPSDHPFMQGRLQEAEVLAVRWRWRLRSHGARARRTHGDFHPFNLLFREADDFSVLDCSRGAAGDPADDVTCLSINYLFFAEQAHKQFIGALRQAWQVFWDAYLTQTRDKEILTVVAPFYAWRALVLASPVWYPELADEVRERLLSFAERLLAGEPFSPEHVDRLLR